MADKTTESVELALAELREMFPLRMVDVQLRTGPNAKYARIDVYALNFMRDAPTLAEAIAKCRQWHAEQAKES